MHQQNILKGLIILLISLGSVMLSAQFGIKKTTRAVIVGISDYEDELIPDLEFAHKDAVAFKAYLNSISGGSIPDDNIKLLTNADATGGNIHKALYWLLKSSEEDDNAIIYFSGHGDVETIYIDEPGHLLVHDSPSSIYQINSIRIEDLHRIINTLSNQKKANVSVFTDACRSGKLAGSEVKGAQATAAALNNQFANEIKLMSCQPNEYSMEGEAWGNGRGAFSYYLIEGLIGLADRDANYEVTLKEIERYLDDRLSDESFKQTPVAIGDKNTKIAYVDQTSLNELKSESDLQAPLEDLAVNSQKQSNPDVLLESFYEALKNGNLIESDLLSNTDQFSAEHYYNLIAQNEMLASKLPIVKGDFISTLQDGAQHAINLYLKADQEEMAKRWYGDSMHFSTYPQYLNKAVELLGESNYLLPQIKAKAIYFDVVAKRIDLDRKKAKSSEYVELEKQLQAALEFQDRSPFIYNELGLVQERQEKFTSALESFDIASGMSPQWPLPYNNKSHVLNQMGQHQKAIDEAQKALDIDPSFSGPLANLASANRGLGNHQESLKFFQMNLEIFPNNCRDMNNAGLQYYYLEDYKSAENYFTQAADCDPNYGVPKLNLGLVKIKTKSYNQALEYLNQAKAQNVAHSNLYNNLGVCFEALNDNEAALENYSKAIEIDPNSDARLNLAMLHLKIRNAEQAVKHFNYYIEHIESDYKWAYFDRACAYALLNEIDAFAENIELAIKYGFNNQKEMEESDYLSSIRSSAVYAELIAKMK